MKRKEDETSSRRRGRTGLEPRPEGQSTQEIDETVKRILRRLCEPELAEIDPALAQAGPKLKAFRERSGWTAPEISARTGVPLQVLEAFEAGEPIAEDVLLPALERLASACCCSVEDLGLSLRELEHRRPLRRAGRTRPDPLW